MSIMKCSEPSCPKEIEFLCKCTSPETYWCEEHLSKHWKLTNIIHPSDGIVLTPVEGSKIAVLDLLEKEKYLRGENKSKLLESFSKLIFNLENTFKELFKKLNSDVLKVDDCHENINSAKRITKLDPVLSLLALDPNTAIQKIKEIIPLRSDSIDNASDFCAMSEEICKMIASFNKKWSDISQRKILSEEPKKAEKIQKPLLFKKPNNEPQIFNEFKKPQSDPNEDATQNAIGIALCEDKAYEASIKAFNSAIIINPKNAVYFINKGNALMELNRIDEAKSCYNEAVRLNQDQDKDKLYNGIGTISYKEKKYEEALYQFENAIKINPRCAVYYKNKANALKELDQLENAKKWYSEAVKIDRNDDESFYEIGNFLYSEKNYDEALFNYNNAVRINKNNANYLKQKGNTLKELNRINEAKECYDKALNINPNDDELCNRYGIILKNEKKYDDALKKFDQAIQINPKWEYIRNKGNAYEESGKIEEAKQCYNEVIKKNQYDDFSYNAMGNILRSVGDYNNALVCYENAIVCDQSCTLYYRNKAATLSLLGRRDDAFECLYKALEIAQLDDSVYNDIGNMLYNEKRYWEALENYENSININPRKAAYYRNKGITLIELNNKVDALECFKNAIRIDSNFDAVYNEIGMVHKSDRNYQEAISNFNRAIQINPKCAVYYRNKGYTLKEMGKIDGAKMCFGEAIKYDQGYHTVYNEMGNILWNEKNFEEAYKYYSWAVKINPNSALYWRNAGDALKRLNRETESKQCLKRAKILEKAPKT